MEDRASLTQTRFFTIVCVFRNNRYGVKNKGHIDESILRLDPYQCSCQVKIQEHTAGFNFEQGRIRVERGADRGGICVEIPAVQREATSTFWLVIVMQRKKEGREFTVTEPGSELPFV